MWTTQAETVCGATPEAVFALWEVERWKDWDHEVEWARLDGPFATGTTGEMKVRGGPRARFTVLAVERNRGFTDRSHLPLTNVDFQHVLEPLAEGALRIKHTVTLSGPLAFFFSRVIGPKLKRGLPHAVKSLGRLAEESSGQAG